MIAEQTISPKYESGVVLLEVLMAILIFSIGILAIIGLQASAVASVSDAKYRIDASNIAEAEIGRMWVDQSNLSSYVGTKTVSELPSGSMTVEVENGIEVTVTVTWTPPSSGLTHKYSTVARIFSS